MKYRLLNRETLFQGYFRTDRYSFQHERFDGSTSPTVMREIYQRTGNVAGVLLFDPQQDKVALVEQFRAGPLANRDEPWTTEIVLGMIDANETPEQAARREAQEEAGCLIAELHPITRYYSSPGGTSEHITLFVGRTEMPKDGILAGVAKEQEDIRVHVMDAMKAIGMIYGDRVRDAQTMVALQWFAMHHTELRSRWLISDVGTPII